MILIKIRNGLGNQLFQYAFGEYLKRKFPSQTVKYDFSELPAVISGRKTEQVEAIFENPFPRATSSEIRGISNKPFYSNFFLSINIRGIRSIISRICNRQGQYKGILYAEPETWWLENESFVDDMLSLELTQGENYYFLGFWENVNYFGPKNIMNEMFRLRHSNNVDSIRTEIEKNNSIVIHIRRGDFLSESENSEGPFYNVCPDSYYRDAIKIITEGMDSPRFFFFSDDPDYVYEHYQDIDNKVVVTGNHDYEDLFLMSCSKNIIVANSTFSFWGAYLGTEKLVIAPRIHYVYRSSSKKTVKYFFSVPGWKYIDNSILFEC